MSEAVAPPASDASPSSPSAMPPTQAATALDAIHLRHPLVMVGLGLLAGFVLARLVRR